jgi:hypothetical protein
MNTVPESTNMAYRFLQLFGRIDKEPADFELHRRGEKQLTAYIDVMGACSFGAIVPHSSHTVDAVAIAKKVLDEGLPLLVTTSPNGAALVWYFGPREAVAEVRAILARYATLLGLEGAEIFPPPSPDAAPGIIGMPYFGDNNAEIRADGEPATCEQFIEHAQAFYDAYLDWERDWTIDDPEPGVSDENAARIVAPIWHLGVRDNAGVAIANILKTRGWIDERINALIDRIAVLAYDEQREKRTHPRWGFVANVKKKIAKKQKCFGIPKLREFIGDDRTEQFLEACGFDEDTEATAAAAPSRFLDPHDLWAKLPPVQTLPRGILPKAIEDLAFIKPSLFPPAALGASALAVCAMATSGNIRVEINANWREPFLFWVANVGASSSGKSSTQSIAFAPLDAIDADMQGAHAKALVEWEARTEEWAKIKKEDRGAAPIKPIPIRFFTQNATIEGLVDILKYTDHGGGLINNELSTLINAMDGGGYKDKSMADRGPWLLFYDAKGGLHFDRRGAGQIYVKNFSGAILGGITTDKIEQVMRAGVADGMMSRFSLIMMPPIVPSDDLDSIASPAYDRYQHLIRLLVDSRPDTPVTVKLADDARRLLGCAMKEWQHGVVHYAESLPRYSERLGKLWGLAARIALGFAIIEKAEDEVPMSMYDIDAPELVTAEQMGRAIAWVKYQTQHDHEFYAMAAGREAIPMIMAQRVAAWILRTKAESFQLGDITRATIKDWAGLKPQEQSMVFDLLEHLGWCRLAQPDLGPALRGVSFQRGVQWIVNEKAHEVYAQRAAYEKRVAEENYRLLQERVAPQRAEARTA